MKSGWYVRGGDSILSYQYIFHRREEWRNNCIQLTMPQYMKPEIFYTRITSDDSQYEHYQMLNSSYLDGYIEMLFQVDTKNAKWIQEIEKEIKEFIEQAKG